jgi:hypothetical protein
MITTNRVPRTRRFIIAAFGLSVLIHLFGGALWAQAAHLVAKVMGRLPEQHRPEQLVATSDVIRLEKRNVPRPAQASRAHAAPHRVARPRPQVRPAAAKIVVAAQPKSKPEVRRPETKVAKPVPTAPPEIAREVTHAPARRTPPKRAKGPNADAPAAPATTRKAALSPAELAQLNAQFSKTIAASHTDLATIQKRTEEQPVATKRYPLQFTGMQANLQRGQGYIEPTTAGQRIGNTIWYYTHYTYMWPDGHLEDDDIPWPFHYPLQRDLFALHVRLIPLQLPPPGFRLNRPLKPFLEHFVQSAGGG